jgi:MFS family permease
VIGLMSTGGSALLVLGPLIASGLLAVGSWRLVFVVNLPVLIYVIVEMARYGPATPPRGTGFPLGSTAWLLLALTATVLGISQLATWGLVSVGLLVVGVGLLAGFVRTELSSPDPLLPVAYLRDRVLARSLGALFAIQFAVLATMVSLVAFLEGGIGVGAAMAGFVVAVTGLGSPLLSLTTGRLADTLGVRRIVVAGLVTVTAGLLLTAAAAPTLTIVWLVPGLLLFGISRPAVFTPPSSGAMAEIPAEDRPIAASLVTEARELGAVIGVSVVGVVADFAGRDTPQEATTGFVASMVATAIVTALALVGVLRGMRRRPSG